MGNHRAAPPLARTGYIRRLTPRRRGVDRGYERASVDESERFMWNGFAIAH